MKQGLPIELRLAFRYLRARTDNGFLSFSTLVGALGIAIGVAVLIVVLSVINGFDVELRERILGIAPHATLSGVDGPLVGWQGLRERALRTPGVEGAAPYVEDRALVARNAHVAGVLIEGVLPTLEPSVSSVGRHLRGGGLDLLMPGGFGAVLGVGLARDLGVSPGDTVVLAVPKGTSTPAGLVPRVKRLRVVGLVESGMYEYDHNVLLLHVDDAARLFRLGAGVTGLRIRVDDPYLAGRVVRRVAVDLGGGFFISDWSRQHSNFFRSIATTKSIMFVLLLLVIAVAAFNIVASLVMLVREKQSDIAILRTLGLTPASLVGVFVSQGALIGLLGTVVGVAGGLLLAVNVTHLVHVLEAALGTSLFDARVYYIDELPSVVNTGDVVIIASVGCLLGVLSTIYPAWRAARTQPAEALRHE
jgi:lipoprotein-releasing system permease protein